MYSIKRTLIKAAIAGGIAQGAQTAVAIPKSLEEWLIQLASSLAVAAVQGVLNWLKNRRK